MAQGAPKGNQFWKVRTKHGRDLIFKDPETMWQAACEYFEWCDKHPLIEIDFKGKDATRVRLPKMRAYTLQGLCLFLGVNTKYFNEFEKTCDKGFSEIVLRIRETVYEQKFTGSAAGFLNPNIIARDLGLREQTDLTTKGKPLQQQPSSITFIPAESLTPEMIEKLMNQNAGNNNEGLSEAD